MSEPTINAAIGGYFALERSIGTGIPWLNEARGYKSARSAIAAVLKTVRPTAVWAPNFICGAVNDALRHAKMKLHHYPLTKTLGVPDQISPASTDLVICVDYFGIGAHEVNRAIERFGSNRVIVDASQALYHRHRDSCTTVYSPRKYLGVPDGGLVRTSWNLPPPLDAIESDSLMRTQHLLYRLAGLIETGYLKSQEAEESLTGCDPMAMSALTTAILRSIDVDTIAARRIRNYECLATSLRSTGFSVPALPSEAVPLCCPVKCTDATHVRNKLAARHIFTPTYWADATIPDDDYTALAMRDETVYLPCDQRYTMNDMLAVHSAVMDTVARSP